MELTDQPGSQTNLRQVREAVGFPESHMDSVRCWGAQRIMKHKAGNWKVFTQLQSQVLQSFSSIPNQYTLTPTLTPGPRPCEIRAQLYTNAMTGEGQPSDPPCSSEGTVNRPDGDVRLQAGTSDPMKKAAVLLRGSWAPEALMVWLCLSYTE